MENGTDPQVTEFILLGLAYHPQTKRVLFAVSLVVYLVALAANSLFIIVTLTDARLHSPMYFFLCNLSVLDLCLSSVGTPTGLGGLLVPRLTVTFSQCMTQMFVALSLGQTECVLLAVIAGDRYVAICNPLRYQQVMNPRVCIMLAIATWTSGILFSLPMVAFLQVLKFCSDNIIDHSVCEAEALSRLGCMDARHFDLASLLSSLFVLLSPLILILLTYFRIIATILRMPKTESRHKAFATCGSHLMVVILFYGPAMVIYLKPKSTGPAGNTKLLSLFYGLAVPALNPLIYTLRNKEVKGSLKKLCGNNVSCQRFKA